MHPRTALSFSDRYETANGYSSLQKRRSVFLSTACFYPRMLRAVLRASRSAKRGTYSRERWIGSSLEILDALERAGVRCRFEGIDVLRSFEGPAVFIGNHMSTFETFVLPMLIEPVKPCTFVVKQELLTYPVFGHIMRALDPIAVTRMNPKKDFATVLDEGNERIRRGMSVIIFPQTTRTASFQPDDFNSLGVKLALRANVPVVPVALSTAAWGNGKWLKDFGRIDPRLQARIAFAPHLSIHGRGAEEHRSIIEFIQSRLAAWSSETDPERSSLT